MCLGARSLCRVVFDGRARTFLVPDQKQLLYITHNNGPTFFHINLWIVKLHAAVVREGKNMPSANSNFQESKISLVLATINSGRSPWQLEELQITL